MTGEGRVGAGQYAQRVNAAADLLARGVDELEATRRLAQRYDVSERQARRYVDRATEEGRIEVPSRKIVLTVKVPVDLVRRIRAQARRSGQGIGAVVTQALREFLERRGGGLHGGSSSG
jgi:hypothetical protein